jgi:spermidine synthase
MSRSGKGKAFADNSMAKQKKSKLPPVVEQSTIDPPSRSSALARMAALGITFCTGLLALVYEVTWQQYLANFLGSQAQATAIILAVFLSGLCSGYLVFGRLSRAAPARQALILCGLSEIGIGVWVLLFPSLYHLVWGHGALVSPESAFSHLWEIAISVLLMGLPTLLMGGTLPLLTQGLALDLDDAGPFHARIYAINTAGAFIGCLLAGFCFLPWWGLSGTLYRLGPLNIVSGIFFVLLACCCGGKLPSVAMRDSDSAEAAPPHDSLAPVPAYAMAFLAGFYSLTLQTVFMRIVGLSMGSSEYSFAMIVAVFIALLAAGAGLLSRAEGRPWPLWMNQCCVFVGSLAVYFTISYWPYASYVVRTLISSVTPGFYLYHAVMFFLLLAVLALPVGSMGSTLPLLFRELGRNRETLGTAVGSLYAWNTLGCASGALLGGYFLLFYGDLDWVYRICLFFMLFSVLLAAPWPQLSSRLALSAAAVCVAGFLLLLQLPTWNKRYLGNGLFRNRSPAQSTYLGSKIVYDEFLHGSHVLAYRDSPNSTVTITEHPGTESSRRLNKGASYVRNMKVNGKSDGETSFGDTRTMRLVAHLPMLFSSEPVERVGIVGFGLGVSAGSVSLYPEVKDIHVVEISPAVKQFSPYFDFANYGVSRNPKIRWSVGDAYRVLGSAPEQYSVIISEPSNPWVTGVERLFSEEFYKIVEAKLSEKGIYAQWIHDYTLSEGTWGLMIRTFEESFPHVRIFRAPMDTIMLGSKEPLDEASLTAFLRRYQALPDVREALDEIALPTPAAVLGLEIWVNKQQFPGAEVQTLEFPKLAHRAGFDFFLGENVNVHDLFEGSSRRLWSRKYEQDAFIFHYLPSVANPVEALEQYSLAACDSTEHRFFSGWQQELKPCRDSLVALAVDGVIDPENGIRQQDVGMLRQLEKEPETDAAKNEWKEVGRNARDEDLHALFDIFGSFDSEFLKLSAEKLALAAEHCFQNTSASSLRCRAHLIEALAVTGHGGLARSMLNSLPRAGETNPISSARLAALHSLVNETEAAFPGKN